MLKNVNAPVVKIDGTALAEADNSALIECVVDLTLNAPAMITLRFDDPKLKLIDNAQYKLGALVQVSAINSAGTAVLLAKGEITAIEPEFRADGRSMLQVRALHRSHRMHYARTTKSFQQVNDGDMIKSVASEAGVTAQTPATNATYKHVFRWNQTAMEFALERSRRVGLVFRCEEDKIIFFKPSAAVSAGRLTYGLNLLRFGVRATSGSHVGDVTFAAWDPVQKKAITGKPSSQTVVRNLGTPQFTASAKISGVYSGASRFVDVSLTDASTATAAAESFANQMAEGAVEMEAECEGFEALVAGAKVTVANVGTRFAGDYLISSARHIWARGAYSTEIVASGWGAQTFTALTTDHPSKRRVDGVLVALVTNIAESNADDGKYGRVKVKFPYLSDSDESYWVRLAMPMTGAERGLLLYPEVNDEVVVAFEDGDPARPIIVGSLWNGQDAMPLAAGRAVENGKVERRIFKTRVGHLVEFNDKQGEEQILIEDKAGNKVILFAKDGNEKITIEAVKDMDIKVNNGLLKITAKNYDLSTTEKIVAKSAQTSTYEATQDLTLKSNANIKGTAMTNIEFSATAQFKASGTSGVELSSNANVKISATANMELSAMAQFKASGTAMAEVSGGAMLKLGGALINIG